MVIWSILVSAGIPSAVIGVVVGIFSKQLKQRDKEKEEKEEARRHHDVMQTEVALASLSLSEAVAKAVQRIPDAKCNGDMHEALKYATDVKNKYRDFERNQTIKSIS